MKQKFIVTIDAETEIRSREIADALNYCGGVFSLNFNHNEIIVATARKIKDKTK